ncbi:DMT family transporter [Coralloluteibacterium stylophorae]|uniref:DMT family transporter n=1 Tax=Coralloluteibacterium stylophorae TaxID=1776034 RepID=A0A8J8AWE4_9GAMM|nr:DMT family transporter [Coralloluteibacterium stylophorae]MBS7457311.1 DMT family transporter [Coralloluteibacterium stylophorae]
MPPAPAIDPQRRAALWMLAAVFLFALMDGGMKWLAADYPPLQVATLRGAAALPPILAWVLLRGRGATLLRVHWRLHLLRGALGIAMMFGFVYGLARMPMATAYSIVFVAPLLITALAVPLLGERVGPRRWTAIAIGMAGVLVVLRPRGEGLVSIAGLALLLAALCYAAAAITVRLLAQRDSTEAMVFWFLALLTVGAGALAWADWRPLRVEDAPAIAVVGIAGALGQVALTQAFRLGEASQIAPLEYSGLVWVVLMDLTVWRVLPDAPTWLGAAIIVASGLYLMRRERVRAGQAPPPP